MPDHYGYIKKTTGADGDHVDVTLGPEAHEPAAHQVYVIDQKDPTTGKFDEHKAMVGFTNPLEAIKSYDGSFSDGSGPSRRGAITGMDFDKFKEWTKGDTSKALTYKPTVGDTLKAKRAVQKAKMAAPKPSEKTPQTSDKTFTKGDLPTRDHEAGRYDLHWRGQEAVLERGLAQIKAESGRGEIGFDEARDQIVKMQKELADVRESLNATKDFDDGSRYVGKSEKTPQTSDNGLLKDDKGQPLRVYHGTTGDIKEFAPEHMGKNTGSPSAQGAFFFTDHPSVAGEYANRAKVVGNAAYDAAKENYAAAVKRGADEAELKKLAAEANGSRSYPNVVPAHLTMKKPLVVDYAGKFLRTDVGEFRDLIDKAKADGHDGVIFKNVIDTPESITRSNVYAVFKPEQARSIFAKDEERTQKPDKQVATVEPKTEPPVGEMLAKVHTAMEHAKRDIVPIKGVDVDKVMGQVVKELAAHFKDVKKNGDVLEALAKWGRSDPSPLTGSRTRRIQIADICRMTSRKRDSMNVSPTINAGTAISNRAWTR